MSSEKNSGPPLNQQDILYHPQRLKLIENGLLSMKNLNKSFLKNYEKQQLWQKVNMGLMKHNIQTSLDSIVEFKACQANKPDKSYFNPFSKKPITMCYNKFIDQQKFNQVLNYNMILHYDSKSRKNMNWNELSDVVFTNVRALHLSGICRLDDKECIKSQLQSRVFTKQRFKGKSIGNLTEVIKEGLFDSTPISQIILRQN